MLENSKIALLERAFSKERLSTYRSYIKSKNVENVDEYVIPLYKWNIEVSSCFLELCNVYEVALRNAIYKSIKMYGNYGIKDNQILRQFPDLRRDIDILTRKHGENIPEGQIVASLSFHTWEKFLKIFFLSKRNNRPLFYAYRTISFENSKRDTDIKFIIKATKYLRKGIRNRICHHDPIFYKDLNKVIKQIMWCLNKIDYKLYEEVNNNYSHKMKCVLSNKPI